MANLSKATLEAAAPELLEAAWEAINQLDFAGHFMSDTQEMGQPMSPKAQLRTARNIIMRAIGKAEDFDPEETGALL
jgi:hypothetical protein